MSQVKTDGWFPIREILNQCSECTWVVVENRMCACEFGKRQFPKAVHCLQFKYEDDE